MTTVRDAVREALEERPYRTDSIEQKIQRVAYALGTDPDAIIQCRRTEQEASL